MSDVKARGSTTEAGLEAVPASRELVEFVPPTPQEGSRYYRFSAPELGGRLGAVALGDEGIRQPCSNPDRDATHEVVVVEGPHGAELRLIIRGWDDEIVPFAVMYGDLPKVDDITVITSDHPGFGLVVSTWHPGEPLGSVKGFEEKPFDEIPSHTGVKLVWDDALEGRVIATFKG